MGFRESLKRVRGVHPPEKRRWDLAHLWIGYVARPLSFPLSAWLMERGVTANQVTFATAVIAYVSVILLASGCAGLMLGGAVGIVVYNLLDCVDGNLGRAKPGSDLLRGRFFDQLVGFSYPLCYLALGIGLRGETGGLPAWKVVHEGVAATQAWQVLALGAWATAAKLLSAGIRHVFWNVLGPSWKTGKRGGLPTSAWSYTLYCTLTELQSHVVLLPLCVAMGWGLAFLAVSAVIVSVELFSLTGLYLVRAWRLR